MSATPIPRTLHMSLLGMRDMSVIETPPKDRLAIHTVVAHFDPDLIKTAIEQELSRGGQVYFVHNRVDSIFMRAASIQELVPQCRIGVGHGQMGEAELEKVLLGFMRHEYDVFVCTTIVENGLDIPLANTMIIENAERYGLVGAVPVARPRGPLEPPRVCVSAGARRHGTERNRAQTSGRAEGVQRSGRGLQNRGARSGTARRGQHCWAASSTGTSRRSASTCTCACWKKRCRS